MTFDFLDDLVDLVDLVDDIINGGDGPNGTDAGQLNGHGNSGGTVHFGGYGTAESAETTGGESMEPH